MAESRLDNVVRRGTSTASPLAWVNGGLMAKNHLQRLMVNILIAAHPSNKISHHNGEKEILHTFNALTFAKAQKLKVQRSSPPLPPISMLCVCVQPVATAMLILPMQYFFRPGGGYPKSTSSEKRKHLASNIEIGGKGACGAQNQMISYFVCKNRYLKSMQYKFRPPSEPIKMFYF